MNHLLQKSVKVHKYIEKYLCLTLQRAPELLAIDFKARFPSSDTRVISHWDEFSAKVRAELQKSKNIVIPDGDADVHTLINFARLFDVVPGSVPKGNTWRANREEIVQGFLYHIDDLKNFEVEVKNHKDKALLRGVTIQPFLLIVGATLDSIHSSYIVINEALYKVDCLLQAFEYVFKAYFALNCGYPIQSQRLWLVVQNTLFNLSVSTVRVNKVFNRTNVTNLVKKLKC